jgi:hypothetical protein
MTEVMKELDWTMGRLPPLPKLLAHENIYL